MSSDAANLGGPADMTFVNIITLKRIMSQQFQYNAMMDKTGILS